jgi:transposase
LRRRGAELRYLPAYSPGFNPIGMMFAKLKALLRQAAERTIPALWDRIGTVLGSFTPDECRNYFRRAGYGARCGKACLENALMRPVRG